MTDTTATITPGPSARTETATSTPQATPYASPTSTCMEFTVTAKDAFGNVRSSGGDADTFTVEVELPDGTVATDRATVTDNNDGTYDVAVTCTGPGKHWVNVKVEDTNGDVVVVSPPTCVFVDGGTTDGATVTGLADGTAGDFITFDIQALAGVAPVTDGGDNFVVSASTGAFIANITLNDNNDGTYNGSFFATAAGTYTVTVDLVAADGSSAQVFTVDITMALAPAPAVVYANFTANYDAIKMGFDQVCVFLCVWVCVFCLCE